jgi:hypothetical protein
MTLGERIAIEGTNWLNLRFLTPSPSRCAWTFNGRCFLVVLR